MRTPKELWIIFDYLDGPHIFHTKHQAERELKKWVKESDSCYDSVWEMSSPIRFTAEKTEVVK